MLLHFLQSLSSALYVASNDDEDTLSVSAVPGLTTLLDTALYQAAESQLTATVTSAHNFLHSWLRLKHEACLLLKCCNQNFNENPVLENFARTCLDLSCESIVILTTDQFSISANRHTAAEPEQSSGHGTRQYARAMQPFCASSIMRNDTGRRMPSQYRGKECWESPRLFCPDYVWANDVANHCQKVLRQLLKHPLIAASLETSDKQNKQRDTSNHAHQVLSALLLLLTRDLPNKMVQFRASVESDATISKRLFLVKSEYRAPIREFLSAHQALQRAPSLQKVRKYLNPRNRVDVDSGIVDAKNQLKKLLAHDVLNEALYLEKTCQKLETEMAKTLQSFAELARYLYSKNICVAHDSVNFLDIKTSKHEIIVMDETLQRLKGILCRKAGLDLFIGIRPLLLDLQGIRRDEEQLKNARWDSCSYFVSTTDKIDRLEKFTAVLVTLAELCEPSRSSFCTKKWDDGSLSHIDIPPSISRECAEFDHELLKCQFQDWFSMVSRQHELKEKCDFDALAEQVRRAEIEVSLAVATRQSLEVVRQRLEVMASDREKRLCAVQELVQDVAKREMSLSLEISGPKTDDVLNLKPTSALGVFGLALQIAGEPLPIG